MVQKALHTILILALTHIIYGQGLQTFDELLQHSFTRTDSIQLEILDARKDYLSKDKGLRINSSAGTNEFGDLQAGNIFRIKAGLEWNLLDEGYMDRKVSAKVLEVEKQILQLQMREKNFNDNYAFIYNHIIYSFNKEKIKFLEEKSYLLRILTKRYEALYHNHAAEYQDLLAISDKSEEMKILLLAIKNYNKHFENTTNAEAPDLWPGYLPILDIHVEELLSLQIPDTTFSQISELKLEKNDLERKLDQQKRLAIYSNLYWRPLQNTGTPKYLYNSIGVRFATGISNRKKERNRVDDLYNQLDVKKNEEKIFTKQKELSNHLLDYHAKLRTYSRFKYKLRALQENKRLDSAIKMVNYKDPQSDLKALNIDLEKLSVEYELLELKQQLYLLLLKIYKDAGVESILPLVSERNFDGIKKKLRGDRIAVIQSAFDLEVNSIFLIEYLKKNEIQNIIFKGNISQNRDFVKTLGESDINIYTGTEVFAHRRMVDIPMSQFSSRIEMEYWIDDFLKANGEVIFVINDLNQLIKIDSAVLEE